MNLSVNKYYKKQHQVCLPGKIIQAGVADFSFGEMTEVCLSFRGTSNLRRKIKKSLVISTRCEEKSATQKTKRIMPAQKIHSGGRSRFLTACGMTIIMFCFPSILHAQDSIKQQTISIFSTYQPKLREAAKLTLTATLPYIDTTRPRLIYNIPAQNLFFTYQPIALSPLAMGKDSLPYLQNNFVKLGFGNYATPLVQLGFGSGRNQQYNYSLFFNHVSSQGDIENQNFSKDNLGVHAQYYSDNLSLHGDLNVDRNGVYYYGYNHDTTNFKKADIRQVFTNLSLNVGLENLHENNSGINFQPELHLTNYYDHYSRKESAFYLKAPFQKTIADGFYFSAIFIGDYSTFADDINASSFSNNITAIHPALNIEKKGFLLHAGLNPTWNNGKFYLLPDIVNETHLIDQELILSSGWISYFTKNSFQHLTTENLFLGSYNNFKNTRVEEKYSGIKGTVGNHFNYNTKFSFVTYYDMPLMVNDSLDGKTFYTRYENKLQAYQLHGEIEYVEEENLSVGFKFDWFNYFKQSTENKPWGLVPFKADIYAQVVALKNFRLTADIFALSGDWYLQNNIYHKTAGAFDANLGAAYQINKKIGVWLNVNNLLNSKYERWHNYPTLGLNAVGGVLIKF